MDELDTRFFVGLSWHFGGGKPYMSGTAGVGVSKRFNAVQPGVNVAVNFYNGGIGARSDSSDMNFDTVFTAKVTAGTGTANPVSLYPLHMDSGTGMNDYYKNSATVGTSFILNNNNRNQQVGFVQLRSDNFSFQFYNDFGKFRQIGIADGHDRWWTGGGKVILGNNNSPYQVIVGSDVFTADTDSESVEDAQAADENFETFKASNPGFLGRTFNRSFNYTPTTASEVGQDFLDAERGGVLWNRNAHSFDLNVGKTSIHGRTPQGTFGVNGIGSSHMFSQDLIHRWINFHLIPSKRPDFWEVQVGPNINQGF